MTKLFSNYKRAAIDFASAQGNYLTDTTGNTSWIFHQVSG